MDTTVKSSTQWPQDPLSTLLATSVGSQAKILYSNNHNLMRTIGFVTILMAAPILHTDQKYRMFHHSLSFIYTACFPLPPEVWNTKPGGILVFAPPCSSWVFLARSLTKRTWANPAGGSRKSVQLANIFCRRMLYMPLVNAYVSGIIASAML